MIIQHKVIISALGGSRSETPEKNHLQSVVSASTNGAVLELTGSSAGTSFNGITFVCAIKSYIHGIFP